MRIAIDAGHYRYTTGKRCLKSIDPEETREWILNSRVAAMLVARLAEYKCEVMRVDDVTGEREVGLGERCKRANDWGADLYLSIHHNAGINGGSGGGTVVFYYSSDPVRKEQAQLLYDYVVAETGLRGNRANPVVKKAYYVLQHTAMPAFLLENGFMDSTTDTPIILTPEHAEKTAEGLLNFIVDTFGIEKREEPTPEPTPEPDIDGIPSWAQDTIKKLVKHGAIKGDGTGINLPYESIRLLVILDRAGVFPF